MMEAKLCKGIPIALDLLLVFTGSQMCRSLVLEGQIAKGQPFRARFQEDQFGKSPNCSVPYEEYSCANVNKQIITYM